MAMVQLDDKTSVNLQDGEVIVYANGKRGLSRSTGELGNVFGAKGFRHWRINLAVTNLRVIVVPYPPNKKGYSEESFNYTNITDIESFRWKNDETDTNGYFYIKTTDGNQYDFMVGAEMDSKTILKVFARAIGAAGAMVASEIAKDASHSRHQDAVDRGESFSKHQAGYNKDLAAYDKMSSDALNNINAGLGIIEARDAIVNVIVECLKMAKK